MTDAVKPDADVHSPAGSDSLVLPLLRRKYALVDLLYRLGTLNRDHVDALAVQFYADAGHEDQPRPLVEVCSAAGLINGARALREDKFLNHVALEYQMDEMDNGSAAPREQSDPPHTWRTMADAFAGYGKARPILKELYSLQALGLAKVTEGDDQENFALTDRGTAYADALKSIFDHANLSPNVLVLIQRYGARMIKKNQI